MRTPAEKDDRGRFGLGWAVVVSVVLHLGLILFSGWVPVVTAPTVAAEQERKITFQFKNDAVEPGPEIPAGVPVEPVRPPAPTVDPSPPVELSVPPDPVPPAAIPAAPSEPEPSRAEDSQPQAAIEQDWPQDREPYRQAPDLRRAARDFGRALAERAPRRTEPEPSGQPRNVVMPDLSQIPSTGFGVGNLVFESRDYDWDDYGRQIYMAIWRAWHDRLWASTDDFERWAHENANWYLKHQTQVRFVIERNGEVTGIAQEAGSGCAPLDLSALDALAEVILPPLPGDFPREREVVHARFLATGEIRALRPVLSRWKRLGLF